MDVAKSKKKSKVVAEDVFTALDELDFDKYEESLRDFLRNYNAQKEDQAQRKIVTKKQKESDITMPATEKPLEANLEEG